MFRELTRKNQQLSAEECIALLQNERRGVLSIQGENEWPYGMPLNHYYHEADGKLYFHSGNVGHRLDALKKCNKASFCTYDEGTSAPGQWAKVVKSVIVFGRIAILDDPDLIADISTRLSHKFTQDDAYIRKEIATHAHRTLILQLTPEHICGKRVLEA